MSKRLVVYQVSRWGGDMFFAAFTHVVEDLRLKSGLGRGKKVIGYRECTSKWPWMYLESSWICPCDPGSDLESTSKPCWDGHLAYSVGMANSNGFVFELISTHSRFGFFVLHMSEPWMHESFCTWPGLVLPITQTQIYRHKHVKKVRRNQNRAFCKVPGQSN